MSASNPHSVSTLEFEYSWMHSPIDSNSELLEEEYSDRYLIDMTGEMLCNSGFEKRLEMSEKCENKRDSEESQGTAGSGDAG